MMLLGMPSACIAELCSTASKALQELEIALHIWMEIIHEKWENLHASTRDSTHDMRWGAS